MGEFVLFFGGDGGGLSQLCWEHCITENYSAILFSICCCFFFFFFLNPCSTSEHQKI